MNYVIGLVPGLVAAFVVWLLSRGIVLLQQDPDSWVEDEAAMDLRRAAGMTEERGPIGRLAYRLVPYVRSVLPDSVTAYLQRLINLAGRPDGIDIDGVVERMLRWLLIMSPAILLFVVQGRLAFVLLAFAAVVVQPLAGLAGAARRRREQINRDLPDFLDVLAVTVTAGLGFRSALATVADRFGGPLSEEIKTVLNQVNNGATIRSAFSAMRARSASEAIDEFVTAYLQSEELGAPLSDTLNNIATDMRRASAQRMRQKASKVSPRVTVVVTMVLVPGALILFVVGMYIGFGDVIKGGLFGG